MKDPRICRLIGYVMLFMGFGFVIGGTMCGGGVPGIILYVIAGLFCISSLVWMIMKVRCPHCGALLHLKLYDISRCPYCHRSTKPDDNE